MAIHIYQVYILTIIHLRTSVFMLIDTKGFTIDACGRCFQLLGKFGGCERFAWCKDGDEFYHLSDFRVWLISHVHSRF